MDEPLQDLSPILRRRASAPPLAVWLWAVLLACGTVVLLVAYVYMADLPLKADAKLWHFENQIKQMNDSAELARRNGEQPVKVMFIGTSRLKNLVHDSSKVSRIGREAGFERPIANGHMTVNWGGFKRITEAVAQLDEAPPDYVVIMPEMFFEDFSIFARLRMAFWYLQVTFWDREFVLSDEPSRIDEPSCDGFGYGPQLREDLASTWIDRGSTNPGPVAAAEMMLRLSLNGTKIYIANIPTHEALARIRGSKVDVKGVLRELGLPESPNIRVLTDFAAIPPEAFCDYAHIDPKNAHYWLRPLFERLRQDNGL